MGARVLGPGRLRLIVLAALVCGAVVVAVVLGSDHKEAKAVWAVFGPPSAGASSSPASTRGAGGPEFRTGELMVLLGFAWFLFTLDAANSPLVYTLSAARPGRCGAACSCTSGSSFPELAG